jgi:lipoprotein NlpI
MAMAVSWFLRIGLSAAVLSTAVCAQAQEPSLETATAMLTARDYTGCIREIDALLQQRSGDRDTYITRGLCVAGRGDYAAAITDYTKALASDPRSVQALYYRAVAHSQAGEFAEGLKDFSRAIAVDPAYAAGYGGRAGAKRLLGDDAGALSDLTRAIQLQPENATLHHARGCMFYDMRNWEQAVADFRRATELEPQGQPFAHARLWLIRSRLGESDVHDQLARFIGRQDLKLVDAWERIVLEFLLGQSSEDDLFNGTAASEPSIMAGRHAQANFYAGSVRLLKGDREGARRLFQAAVATDRRSFSEYLSAAVELKQLTPAF